MKYFAKGYVPVSDEVLNCLREGFIRYKQGYLKMIVDLKGERLDQWVENLRSGLAQEVSRVFTGVGCVKDNCRLKHSLSKLVELSRVSPEEWREEVIRETNERIRLAKYSIEGYIQAARTEDSRYPGKIDYFFHGDRQYIDTYSMIMEKDCMVVTFMFDVFSRFGNFFSVFSDSKIKPLISLDETKAFMRSRRISSFYERDYTEGLISKFWEKHPGGIIIFEES